MQSLLKNLWNKIKRPQFLVGLLTVLFIYLRDALGIGVSDAQLQWVVVLVATWIFSESAVDVIRAWNSDNAYYTKGRDQ